MQRVCFLLKVRPDRLDEYRERHRNVWPEMLDALRRRMPGLALTAPPRRRRDFVMRGLQELRVAS